MFVFFTTLIISTIATFGSSAPTPTDPTAASPIAYKGACSTVYPSSMQVISSTEPNQAFAIDNSALKIQENTATGARVLQYVDFEVPYSPDVWGCQLHVADKNNLIRWTNSTGPDNSTIRNPPSMNVIALQANWKHRIVTYNNTLNASPSVIVARYFGYFKLGPGRRATLNSRACPPLTDDGKNGHLSFVVEYEYPSWRGNMEWNLPQKVVGDDVSGMYISYGDCWT